MSRSFLSLALVTTFLLIGMVSVSWAVTRISDNISTDTTWTVANSPYLA